MSGSTFSKCGWYTSGRRGTRAGRSLWSRDHWSAPSSRVLYTLSGSSSGWPLRTQSWNKRYLKLAVRFQQCQSVCALFGAVFKLATKTYFRLPNWYSFLSLLASTRYLRKVVVLQVLGSFMAVMAVVMASSNVPPFSRTWLPVRFSCDRETNRNIIRRRGLQLVHSHLISYAAKVRKRVGWLYLCSDTLLWFLFGFHREYLLGFSL